MNEILIYGNFGCLHFFHIDSNENQSETKKTFTKLEKNNFTSENEYFIGKQILSIPYFKNHFVPVVKCSYVDLRKINSEFISHCDVVDSYSKDYVLLHYSFFHKIEFYDFISNIKCKGLLLHNFFDTYLNLIISINKLIQSKIVHFNLHENNIVYDNNTKMALLQNFRFSLHIPNITSLNIQKYFNTYNPCNYFHPLEIHVLCYLLNKTSNTLTKKDINIICEDFCSNFPFHHDNLLTDCLKQLEIFIDLPRSKVIDNIMFCYKTWDNYSLSIMYIKLCKYIDNDFINLFGEILHKNISINPELRYSLKDTYMKFNNIFQKIDDIKVYRNLLEQM